LFVKPTLIDVTCNQVTFINFWIFSRWRRWLTE